MQNLNDGPCSTIIYLLGSIVNESWVFTAKGFVFRCEAAIEGTLQDI